MKKLFIFALMAIVAMASCTRVDSGEVGIKFKKFSVTEQGDLQATNCSGYTWYNPFTTSVYTYPIYQQQKDYIPFTVMTKDAAVFSMDPYLTYSLQREKAIDVFKKYRMSLEDIEDRYMKTCIYDAYRICANKYTSDELMSNREAFENNVRTMLDSSLMKEGFHVDEFTSQITPPASLSAMIDAKNAAVQSALKAENQVKEAEANAKIAVAKAKGKADALKIEADGEAYYNRTVAQSLNALLVQQYALEKWDGKLPNTNASNSIPFLNIK